MQATDVVHVYSYRTGVSFELPAGFEVVGEEQDVASYVWRDDSEDAARAPRVVVRVVVRLDDQRDGPDAVRQLVEAAAQHLDVTERRTEVVDGEPVTTVVGHRSAEPGAEAVVVHQSVVAVEDRVISIAAMFDAGRADEMVPALDRAIRSMRFVLL